jgi:hypothetical protein
MTLPAILSFSTVTVLVTVTGITMMPVMPDDKLRMF